jgi:hypothetical protein
MCRRNAKRCWIEKPRRFISKVTDFVAVLNRDQFFEDTVNRSVADIMIEVLTDGPDGRSVA